MSYPRDEPTEWSGRGRPDWHTGVPASYTGRAEPVSHRGTGEQRRIRADAEERARAELQRLRDADRQNRQELVVPANPPVPEAAPVVVVENDPLERFAIKLGICRDVVVILAVLVFLYLGGFALVHGGWPIWIPDVG